MDDVWKTSANLNYVPGTKHGVDMELQCIKWRGTGSKGDKD